MADTDIESASLTGSQTLHFELPVRAAPERLDKTLARLLPEHSRSRLQDWIQAGRVLVNGVPGRASQTVYPTNKLVVHTMPAPQALAYAPQDVDFEVVADSSDWIVVNKPAGLVTHPGAGNWQGTLLNGLLHRYPELDRVARAGIVHRLDKDTSGLLVVARTELAQTHLVRQLQQRSMGREYRALAQGRIERPGTAQAPIGRDPRVPVRMTAVRPIAPKPAVTHYQPLRQGRTSEGGWVTELACRLETGRTHQIRVHLSNLGHALVGDTLYGGGGWAGVHRQLLHARRLEFDDPGSHQRLVFEAPVPDDFQQALESVSWE